MINPDTHTKEDTDVSSTDSETGQEATPDGAAPSAGTGTGHAVTLKDLHAYYGAQHAVRGASRCLSMQPATRPRRRVIELVNAAGLRRRRWRFQPGWR